MYKNPPQKILNRKNLFAKKHAPNAPLLRHQMSGAEDCIRVWAFAVVDKILIRFGATVDELFPAGDVAVIVKLMNHRCKICQIDYGQSFLPRALDEPLIEPHAPDHQRWNLFVRAPPKYKTVDARMAIQPPIATHALLEFFFPAVAEVQRFANFQVGPASHR